MTHLGGEGWIGGCETKKEGVAKEKGGGMSWRIGILGSSGYRQVQAAHTGPQKAATSEAPRMLATWMNNAFSCLNPPPNQSIS